MIGYLSKTVNLQLNCILHQLRVNQISKCTEFWDSCYIILCTILQYFTKYVYSCSLYFIYYYSVFRITLESKCFTI